MKRFTSLFLFLISTAGASEVPPQSVILLTLDGVRVNEVHSKQGRHLLPALHRWVKEEEGVAFGGLTRPMKVSNRVAMSLPGYRALMSGRFETTCGNNNCSQIRTQTLFDRLPGVVFASWDRISRAVHSTSAPMEGSIAFQGFHSSIASVQLRERIVALQKRAAGDLPPWRNARWDSYTWQMAYAYLAKHEQPVTYLSFLDSDEWGHDGDLRMYYNSIKEFDQRLQELRRRLAEEPGRLERTSFVITTDHGRGRGDLWKSHGRLIPHSRKIWAFVIPSQSLRERYDIRPSRQVLREQSQIRSTVEILLSPEDRPWESDGRRRPLIQMSLRPAGEPGA